MKKSTARKYTDYFLLTFLIAVTGFPLFYSDIEFFIIGFILSAAVFFRRNLGFDKLFLPVIVAFMAVEILQSVFFSLFEIKTFLGTVMRLGFAYFTIRVVAGRFFEYYFNVIYFFAAVSLVFYIPSIIDINFAQFFVDNVAPFFVSPFHTPGGFYEISPNIVLYTFEKSLFVSSRNSGPFWEPGAFSIFLVLAMMFRLVQKQDIVDRRIILLAITVLTTTSTSGYFALFLLIISYYLFNRKIHVSKYVMVALLAYGAGLAYMQLEFLGKKAENDIVLASETTTSRFGSALADLQDFSKNPIIGYGRGQNRYGGRSYSFFSKNLHRNNGITQLLVTYGILIFVMYFYLYHLSFTVFCRQHGFNLKFATAMLFIVMIMGFSQAIFTKPFFFGLMFLSASTKNLSSKNDTVTLSVD